MPIILGNLLTMTEVGEILQLSPGRVSQLIKGGRLPIARRLGKNYLFSPSEVKRFAKKPRPNGRPRRAG